ncbi:MAG: hypothetical protein AAGD32_17160 [Planctomycetota bacterium]
MEPQAVTPLELEYDGAEAVEGPGRRGRVVGVAIVAIVAGVLAALGGLLMFGGVILSLGMNVRFGPDRTEVASVLTMVVGCLLGIALAAVPLIVGGVALLKRRAWGRSLVLGAGWLLFVSLGGFTLSIFAGLVDFLINGFAFWRSVLMPLAIVGGFGWLAPGALWLGIGSQTMGDAVRRQNVGPGTRLATMPDALGTRLIGGAQLVVVSSLLIGLSLVDSFDEFYVVVVLTVVALMGGLTLAAGWLVPRLAGVLLIGSTLLLSGWMLYETGLTYEYEVVTAGTVGPARAPVQTFKPDWDADEFFIATLFMIPAWILAIRLIARGQ